MKKNVLVILCILVLVKSACGQEILAVDTTRSFVLNLDEGAKKYLLEEFLKNEQLSFLERQKLEAHIFIMRKSNPRDTYVLEMRTDLWNAEWQYKISGETTVFKTAKFTVWDSPQEHSASSFEIVLTGEVPKPAIKIEEPYFKDYTGEGPGFRKSELAVFTIYDGQEAINKVQDVGGYAFLSTNPDIKRYLEEIKKNTDTSVLGKEYALALEEQKNHILLLSTNGHVGLALDLSKSFAGMVNKLPSPDRNGNSVLLGALAAILLALVTGFIGYQVGHGKEGVDTERIEQLERSYSILKQNVEKLDKIDISSIPGAETQATELETVKRQVAPSIARLKHMISQMRSK
jgi:hypothetical protein